MENMNRVEEIERAAKKDQNCIMEKNPKRCSKIFRENAKMLKRIIREDGWPTQGKKAHYAWLIAQHSDHDPGFQMMCLGLHLPNISKNKERMLECIYLIDRILVNTGNKQIFGTQINSVNKPFEIFEPEHVNNRRKQVGLKKIGRYIESVRKFKRINTFPKAQ